MQTWDEKTIIEQKLFVHFLQYHSKKRIMLTMKANRETTASKTVLINYLIRLIFIRSNVLKKAKKTFLYKLLLHKEN